MAGGPTTTTKQKEATNSLSNGLTNVAGTSLVNSNTLGSSYDLGKSATTSAQQGLTGSANYSANNAYAPAEPVVQDILKSTGSMLGNVNLSGAEQGAISGAQDQATKNLSFNPAIENATSYMLGGGDVNQGNQYITEGYDAQKAALDPYARGDYVNFDNPQLQGMLSTIRDDITNQVGGLFAGAGRSFSGAHANTLARGLASGMAPTMLDWYTGQQRNQMDAANAMAGNAYNASAGLGANTASKVGAMSAAPGMLSATLSPYNTMLDAAQYGRNAPVDTLSKLTGITMQPAAQFGSSYDLGSGYNNQTGQSSTVSENYGLDQQQQQQLSQNNVLTMLQQLQKGSGTSSGTQQTKVDPITALLGAGTMLGSAWLGRPST